MELYCGDCKNTEFELIIDENLFKDPRDPEKISSAEFTTSYKCKKCGKMYPVYVKKV